MSVPQHDEETITWRRFVLALVFSLLVMIGGIAWTWQVGQKANKIAHRLAHQREGLEDLQKIVGAQEAKAQ